MLRQYILFDNHEQAIALRSALKAAGFHTEIAPTPRTASLCCGVSLRVAPGEEAAVKAYLQAHGQLAYRKTAAVEESFSEKRDHYC